MARIDTGGGTYFDPDLVDQGINHLKDGLRTVEEVIKEARVLDHIVSPAWGNEPLTQSFHAPMQASHSQDMQGYLALQTKLTNQIANLEAAKKHYMDADAAGAHGLTQRGV
jgi:hypothetical protein